MYAINAHVSPSLYVPVWSSPDLAKVSFKIFSGVGRKLPDICDHCYAQVDHWWLNPRGLGLFIIFLRTLKPKTFVHRSGNFRR